MGVAAYNRGSELISRQIEQDGHQDSIFRVLDRLDTIPAGDVRLFAPDGIIRVADRAPRFCLMNQPEKGWASASRDYERLADIQRTYALRIIMLHRDALGNFWSWVAAEPGTLTR